MGGARDQNSAHHGTPRLVSKIWNRKTITVLLGIVIIVHSPAIFDTLC
jgi:hypothetical protein